MKPLILDFKTNRIPEQQPVAFVYDFEQSLNVIEREGMVIPIIEADRLNAELMTKTKVTQERDDDRLLPLEDVNSNFNNLKNGALLLELTTKTLVAQERDDVRNDFLFELTTKTRVKSERDDEHFDNN
ncbi:hypothetical protein [Mucilaginibacter celer]|uniref:Uncharacterized protein n=1 Tax=Mucilaginibacter celer TaxID=2305508 RepID=A0A494VYY5_9SPHI|nr:hypothetical protein [Mucilaginibacter celer]AYL96528.1 hypothetical protein HYN43_015010 [Mucilaginibacter celer]